MTIYQSPFPKRRIGRWCDGGYAIADIPGIKYDILIAGGVCDDISFEEDFIRYQLESSNVVPVYAFDGTVTELPKSIFQNQIQFIQKNIGGHETTEITNLHTLLYPFTEVAKNSFASLSEASALARGVRGFSGETLFESRRENPNSNVFVKMDIEGGEVDWIKSLRPEHMNTMAQIVMEFHSPFTNAEIDMFKKLNETHLPIHFHPNNACGTRIHNGVYFPNVFECTYLHKRFFPDNKAELNRDYIPNEKVDVRNIGFKDEIWIGHPPFVHFEKFVRDL